MPSGGIFNMKIDTFDHKALLGPPKIPGLPDSAQVASSLDNGNAASKKSNKKKKKSQNSSNSAVTTTSKYDSQTFQPPPVMAAASSDTQQSQQNGPENVAVDPAKKLRNLKKKLRDIETLEKKLADGSLTNPEPEQLEKVQRKGVMLDEIAQLEAMVANMST